MASRSGSSLYSLFLLILPSTSRYVDPCTWQDCTENRTTQWDLQLDLLVDAYLDYRSRDSGDGWPNVEETPSMEPPSDSSPQAGVSLIDIELIDLFSAYDEEPLLHRLIYLQSEANHLFLNRSLSTNTPMRH